MSAAPVVPQKPWIQIKMSQKNSPPLRSPAQAAWTLLPRRPADIFDVARSAWREAWLVRFVRPRRLRRADDGGWAASCLDSNATLNKHIKCGFFFPGSEEDFRLHPGAEREGLRSQRSAAHRPYRERHESRILSVLQRWREMKKNSFRHFRQNWEMPVCVLWVIFHHQMVLGRL